MTSDEWSGRFGSDGVYILYDRPPSPLNLYPFYFYCYDMSPHHEDTHTVASFTGTEHTEKVHEEPSIGKKLGDGVHAAYNIVHGIGESLRGMAIDVADFGKGSGKEIAEDGKAEAKQGVRTLEGSLRR